MWEFIMEWIGRLSPIVFNIWIAHWAYASIQQHSFAKVAGWIVFILFSECDRIKSKIDLQTDRIHAIDEKIRRLNASPAMFSRCHYLFRDDPNEEDWEANES